MVTLNAGSSFENYSGRAVVVSKTTTYLGSNMQVIIPLNKGNDLPLNLKIFSLRKNSNYFLHDSFYH